MIALAVSLFSALQYYIEKLGIGLGTRLVMLAVSMYAQSMQKVW